MKLSTLETVTRFAVAREVGEAAEFYRGGSEFSEATLLVTYSPYMMNM